MKKDSPLRRAILFCVKKVNTNKLQEQQWDSPAGKFRMRGIEISEALGRDPQSTDIMQRHPFDVEIQRIPAGAAATVFHAHSAQWEFYHIITGTGTVRDDSGMTPIEPGDAFIFKPREAHQIIAGSDTDLVMYVVADNPIGEHHYYPDSNKWGVSLPERRHLRGEPLDYFDGEE